LQSEPKSGSGIHSFFGEPCHDPLDQLRLPADDFDRLMQAAKPIAEADRDAFLGDIAASTK
jgi:hypothetical protein